jgi:hypothetical protein
MAFTFHTDPGHGWLEVSFTELRKVGLMPGDFSGYSYQQGSVVYLEEDCDASIFLRAYEATHGKSPELIEKYSHFDSWIRRLKRIQPNVLDDELPW